LSGHSQRSLGRPVGDAYAAGRWTCRKVPGSQQVEARPCCRDRGGGGKLTKCCARRVHTVIWTVHTDFCGRRARKTMAAKQATIDRRTGAGSSVDRGGQLQCRPTADRREGASPPVRRGGWPNSTI
jgi:hypothetical protein